MNGPKIPFYQRLHKQYIKHHTVQCDAHSCSSTLTLRESAELDRHPSSSSSSSRKSQSVRLKHNTLELVAASCTYASAINASKDIQCIRCVQT